ncbi:MAG: hypothetical protein U0414_36655 [Polyangiaceae bacterium]
MDKISLGALSAFLCLVGLGSMACDDGGGTGGATTSATSSTSTSGSGSTSTGGGARGAVHVVLFTHIEDTTPGGVIGMPQNETNYLAMRDKLVEVAEHAKAHALTWVLQPDWKYLEAALVYEDAATTASTGGKNVFAYLHEDLGVAVDPHSHENGGYNYTDVAHLLELLGVGGSTVIGGHIWDPALPQFQEWDRFRVAVAGEHYPGASWRGDILIGAGTPNHVNDPLVSGVWRPKDRDNFFVDDPAGNIVAVGAWHDDVAGVTELVDLYANGTVPPDVMLTASWNITPTAILAAGGVDQIDADVFTPIAKMRDDGSVVVTDFQALVTTWKSSFGAKPGPYAP